MAVKAGKWLRVSSGGQDEANQEPALDRYIAGRGYDLAKTYTVHGKSASKGHQQRDLDEVLADMRAGVIDVLVIWHSDRLERRTGKPHTSPLMDVLAEVHAAGGRVESEQEPTLGKLDMGSATLTFMAGQINAEKSRHLAEQVRAAHDRSREAGALVGSAPFGYVAAGAKYAKRLEATEQGRAIVPEIFRRKIAGASLAAVCAWLDTAYFRATGPALSIAVMPDGLRPIPATPVPGSSGTWWPRTVGHMIRNATYTGRHYQAGTDPGTVSVHRCEALVDATTFARAGAALASQPKRGPAASGPAMLSPGVIKCPRCDDSPMYRISGRYYRCAGRGAQRKGCGIMVDLAATDRAVSDFLAGFTSPVMAERFIRGHDHAAEIDGITADLRALPALGLDEDAEDDRRAELRAERKRLAALPSVPDRTVLEPTGATYGQAWDKLPELERPAWLRQNGITVRAARTDSGVCEAALPGWQLAQFGAAALLTEDGVSVLIGWRSSSIDWADEDPADAE